MIAIFFTGVVILLAKLPIFPEEHVLGVASRPWTFVALQMSVAVLLYLSSVMGARGSSRLPVSLSTTAHVAARMLTGYLADVLLFGSPIGLLDFLGACCMIGSSAAIASMPTQQAPQPPQQVIKEV